MKEIIEPIKISFPIRDEKGDDVGKKEIVVIDPTVLCTVSRDLTAELEKHPGNYAWIAVLSAKVRSEFELAKDSLNVLSADLDGTYRTVFETEGKKITEKAISAAVEADGAYQLQKSQVMGWQKMVDMVYAVRDALIHKRDCLIQLASTQRAEMKQVTE